MASVEITARYEHRYPTGAQRTFLPGVYHRQPRDVVDRAVAKGKGVAVARPKSKQSEAPDGEG